MIGMWTKNHYERLTMKVKDIIPIINLKETVVFVSQTAIEKVPSLKQLIDEQSHITYGEGDYKDYVVMVLEPILGNDHFQLFEVFKFKNELDVVMNMEIEKMGSYMIDYDWDMFRIVVK